MKKIISILIAILFFINFNSYCFDQFKKYYLRVAATANQVTGEEREYYYPGYESILEEILEMILSEKLGYVPVVIVDGPPASGKSTIARVLREKLQEENEMLLLSLLIGSLIFLY